MWLANRFARPLKQHKVLYENGMAAVMSFLVWLQALPAVNPLDIGSCHWQMVDAYATQEFDVILEGGEAKEITVHADGDLGLELYVYDDEGDLIGSDAEPQATLTVSIPAGTVGWVTVHVVIAAGQANSFTICAE